MGVDVDESRRDQLAAGVDHLHRRAVMAADVGDTIADDHDVGLDERTAAAVDHRPSPDDQICPHGGRARQRGP
jgi:hypothetical protein